MVALEIRRTALVLWAVQAVAVVIATVRVVLVLLVRATLAVALQETMLLLAAAVRVR